MRNIFFVPFSPYIMRWVLLSPMLLWASYTDLRRSVIPNTACFLLLCYGLTFPIFPSWDLGWGEVIGATVLTFAASFGLYLLGQGAGDAKLLTGLASLFGYSIVVVAALAYVLAGVTALILLALKRITRKTRLPLAPAFALATALYLVYIGLFT